MARQVTIPKTADPFIVSINNVVYSYRAGSVQTVPDEVADVIDNITGLTPAERREIETGSAGQVWTKQEHGADWEDLPETVIPEATAESIGGVLMGEAVSYATDPVYDTVTQINALIDSLVAAGVLAPPEGYGTARVINVQQQDA